MVLCCFPRLSLARPGSPWLWLSLAHSGPGYPEGGSRLEGAILYRALGSRAAVSTAPGLVEREKNTSSTSRQRMSTTLCPTHTIGGRRG